MQVRSEGGSARGGGGGDQHNDDKEAASWNSTRRPWLLAADVWTSSLNPFVVVVHTTTSVRIFKATMCHRSVLVLPFLGLPSLLVMAGQIPVPPFFTPCNFPVPTQGDPLFRSPCHSYPSFPFICDLHQQLAHSSFQVINASYHRYKQFFVINNRPTFGVIIVGFRCFQEWVRGIPALAVAVRQLEPPDKISTVYDDSRFSCIFDSDCQRIDADVVSGFVNNVRTFLRVYTWKVYERWFADNEGCAAPNALAILVIDGMVNDARKIPYVRVHSGESRLKSPLGNIELEAANAIAQGWPLQKVIEDIVDDIGYALKEFHDLGGEPRDHSVPRYIVRRKLAIRKSASGIKITTGKSKTHLMF